jgi:hypothetical protein
MMSYFCELGPMLNFSGSRPSATAKLRIREMLYHARNWT